MRYHLSYLNLIFSERNFTNFCLHLTLSYCYFYFIFVRFSWFSRYCKGQSVCLSVVCLSIYLSTHFHINLLILFQSLSVFSSPIYPSMHSFISVKQFLMTSIQHNALLRQARSMDAWWSAPLSNLAATWTNWFSDRLKKIKPAIKTSRKVLNGPYVHNTLSYVFFPSFSSGHPSYLHWQVTGHANVTVMAAGLCPSFYFVKVGHINSAQSCS